jgi:hypothetical protein
MTLGYQQVLLFGTYHYHAAPVQYVYLSVLCYRTGTCDLVHTGYKAIATIPVRVQVVSFFYRCTDSNGQSIYSIRQRTYTFLQCLKKILRKLTTWTGIVVIGIYLYAPDCRFLYDSIRQRGTRIVRAHEPCMYLYMHCMYMYIQNK